LGRIDPRNDYHIRKLVSEMLQEGSGISLSITGDYRNITLDVDSSSGTGGVTGAVGFSISPEGDLLIGYAGATPTATIDGDGNLLLEV
jgi:hypothetical protein